MCEYEFASLVLVKVKEPKDVLEPRFRLALFLGYAPAVTHGYYVLHKDGRVELTSNLKEKPVMDNSEEFHREKLPDNLEEETPEDPIDPFDSDMEILDKMERDYHQEDVYQNIYFKVQYSEDVHGEVDK